MEHPWGAKPPSLRGAGLGQSLWASSGCPQGAPEERELCEHPGLGTCGGAAAAPDPCAPSWASSTSLPLPGAREPEPPEQLPGVDPPTTFTGARCPPEPLGDVQGAASLIALSQPLQQVQSSSASRAGAHTEVGKPPAPHTHPGAAPMGARWVLPCLRKELRGSRAVGGPGRLGQLPRVEEAGGGRRLGAAGRIWALGTPFSIAPPGSFAQPGLGAGHEALGGGFRGLQDAAGEPGAAGGPAAVQHLPPAAGGSGGRRWR